ncbi:MAG: tetraacyldisaccharide 4'-kinase [Rikenellaceae bacterium]
MKKTLLTPLSWLYLLVINTRHWLFNTGLKSSKRFATPTICVGNITVGGTGKTPMSELLIEELSKSRKRVALLSRGYGRKSRGYREVECSDSYLDVGDEPLQMKLKYPEALVVVCEKRVEGIERIEKEHPDVELIIMDDGFQHRYVTPWVNIIIIDATRPIAEDMMLPAGSLRDTPKRLENADIFVITKCKDEAAMERATKGLPTTKNQPIFATTIANQEPKSLFESEAKGTTNEVIALAGIGNPKPFIDMIDRDFSLAGSLIYKDHHSYTNADIAAIVTTLNQHPNATLLMTEKDSVKLRKLEHLPAAIKERAYYSPIKMKFICGDAKELIAEVEKRLKKD